MPSTFTLHSNDLGGVVRQPQRHFSVGGGNRSPQLSWTNPPEGTKSFAVTIHDPDAPTGSGFWHWLAVNLPSSVRELPSGAGDPALGLMPEQAVQIRNDAGFAGYSGSFPPAGHGWHLY
ncbi:MAG: YbhB/YbcL family Raf kinase inhibitor-like protein, partial [Akkermansia sp.]